MNDRRWIPTRTPEEYRVQLQQHEEEMLPLVAWLWGILILSVLLGWLWYGVLEPLLQHLGIHI